MKNGKQTIIDILNSPYLYLVIGALIMLLYNGRYIIPLAAWLWPIFFLRFIKKQKILTGIIIGGLTLAAISVITMYGKIPLKGMFYYLIAGSMGTTLLVPFLISKLASYKIKGFASTLALPLVWTSLEYINSCVSPFGTFGSIAYTQYANLPLLQLASVTGIWGIVFLITWFASVVNWIWDQNFNFQIIRKGAGLYSTILVLVLLFGNLRLSLLAPASYPLRAAAITVPNQYHTGFNEMDMEELYGKKPEEFVNALLKLNSDLKIPEYMVERTSIEAEAGAKLVIWSEGAVPILKKEEDAFIKQCGNLARDKKIYILMTLVSYLPDFPKQMPENKNIMIDPSGMIVNQYLKSVLVPGELGVAGNKIIQVAKTDYGRIGSVICFDMDFPALIKQAAKKETDIMLVPSSDWSEIEPLHTYQAAFRAVENGFSLVRSVSKGMSAAFDYQGRILAAADYYKTDNVSMPCFIPTKGVTTIYSKIDDTFAWLSLLASAAMIFILIKMKKWLTVIGCLAICAVLVVLIGQQFKSPKPVDNPHPPQSSDVSNVTVDPKVPQNTEKEKDVTIAPSDTTQPTSTDNGAVSSGTEQTIQGDVSKPEYTEEQLQDPTQKPNGEKVTEPPTAVDHDKVEQPKETPKSESQPQGGETKDGKIYVPGFGWIDDIGDGQGTTVDGDGDINKRVGIMD